jgi:hypothetical protein
MRAHRIRQVKNYIVPDEKPETAIHRSPSIGKASSSASAAGYSAGSPLSVAPSGDRPYFKLGVSPFPILIGVAIYDKI